MERTSNLSNVSPYIPKQTNVHKILGAESGQEFTLGDAKEVYHVDEEGLIFHKVGTQTLWPSTRDIFTMFNHPEKIRFSRRMSQSQLKALQVLHKYLSVCWFVLQNNPGAGQDEQHLYAFSCPEIPRQDTSGWWMGNSFCIGMQTTAWELLYPLASNKEPFDVERAIENDGYYVPLKDAQE